MKSAIAIAGLALTLTTGGALAAPVGLGSTPTAETAVIQVHGVHWTCQSGPAGWHKSYRNGARVACRAPRPSGIWWTWRTDGGRSGWYHRRERRWN
ncbi:MAG: hypothetical protein ABL898_08255 [Hyphomicrobiaceae bacterium]